MDLDRFRNAQSQMVRELADLVAVESPSSDLSALAECAEAVDRLGSAHLGIASERIEVEGRPHLRWSFGSHRRVVLLGHFDTVWPLGTTERWPFSENGDRVTGPGCFDMKGGIVQLFHALGAVGDVDGVAVVLTSDEEIGSPTSRGLIEETASGAAAVLVPEPSAAGALKTERKGVSHWEVEATGRAAHAGLEPEKGINAALELAHQIVVVADLADTARGTTVTPTVVAAGTSRNSVPGHAKVHIDVRVPSVDEEERVATALRGLTPVLDGTSLRIERASCVPPMPRSISAKLFSLAQDVAAELGLPELQEASVGGGSDGNFTASLGIRTLDGLGAVGGNAHAEGEYVEVATMPERAALVAGLVQRLLA